MDNSELLFICTQCEHNLYIKSKGRSALDIGKILTVTECPNCGNSGQGCWNFARFGDYESEILNQGINTD